MQSTSQIQLWRTDGTVGNTQMITVVTAGVSSSGYNINFHFKSYDGYVYFDAPKTVQLVRHNIWKTDGTPEGNACGG